MTTTYKEPRIEIEQQFQASASNTFLPELTACIVAPFYNVVEKEEKGDYIGDEEEYLWNSAFPVDTRADANYEDEAQYPLTVLLEDAITKTKSNVSGGTIEEFKFTSTSAVFSYSANPIPTTLLSLKSGTYTHKFANGEIVAQSGYSVLKFDSGATGYTVPALDSDFVNGTNSIQLKYIFDIEGRKLSTGDTFPAAGYIIGPITGTLDDDDELSYGGNVYCTVNGSPQSNTYVAHTADPTFYSGFDNSSVATAISLQVSLGVYRTGTVVGLISIDQVLFYSGSTISETSFTDGSISRGSLLPSETDIDLLVRTITSESECTIYFGKIGVTYSNLVFDVLEKKDYEIPIYDFSTWGITLLNNGVRLPQNLLSGSLPIISAAVSLQYRALRTDLFESLETVNTISELEDVFGATTFYNTGAYMVYLALLNASGRPISFTGTDSTYFTSPDAAFSSALDFLNDKRVYAIAIASMRTAVHSLLDAHVKGASTSEKNMWRIGITSHRMATYAILEEAKTTGAGYVDIYREGFTGSKLVCAGSEWALNGIKAGDSVYIKDWGNIEPKLLYTKDYTGGGTSCTVADWNSAYTTVTIPSSGLNQTLASGWRGKTIKFTFNTSGYNTSNDTGTYSDETRPEPLSQTYADLGYKVIRAIHDATGTTTLYLYTTGSSITGIDGSQTLLGFSIYDGPLSYYDEQDIRNNYITIGNVDSDEIISAVFKSGYTGTYTSVVFEIRDKYDKTKMCTQYALYTKSFANRRLNFVYPYVYLHSSGTQLNGYFIGAAQAGLIAGSLPHQPLTSQGLTGFYSLLYSNKYFSRAQLNEIAGGGVTIYTQEIDNARIICRHQLTSDMENVLTQENSVTRAADTACYMVYDALSPLIGRYNIVDDIFTIINTKINAIRNLLVETKYAKYGSILSSLRVVTLRRDPTAQDGLYLEIEIETQKPFNRARVLMKVR